MTEKNKERDLIALDEASVKESLRTLDKNGYLHVAMSRLTREQVAPYYGNQIPGWKDQGLDPERIYYAYRPAEELQKALDTFNGVPLLIQHKFDSSTEPNTELRVGTIGTSAKWSAPFVTNALTVWNKEAIDAIEDGTLRDLSCGYRYKPIFKSGKTEDGLDYDLVMTDIHCNHVALVHDGRAPECYVEDENLKPLEGGNKMSEEVKTTGAMDDFTEFTRRTIEASGVELTPEQKDKLVQAFAEAHAEFEKNAAEAAESEVEDEVAEPSAEEQKVDVANDGDSEECTAADEEGEPKPEEPKSDDGAMDAALILERVREFQKAESDTKDVIGAVDSTKFKSPESIYKAALDAMKIQNIPEEAAKHVFLAIQKDRASRPTKADGAMDEGMHDSDAFLQKFIR